MPAMDVVVGSIGTPFMLDVSMCSPEIIDALEGGGVGPFPDLICSPRTVAAQPNPCKPWHTIVAEDAIKPSLKL